MHNITLIRSYTHTNERIIVTATHAPLVVGGFRATHTHTLAHTFLTHAHIHTRLHNNTGVEHDMIFFFCTLFTDSLRAPWYKSIASGAGGDLHRLFVAPLVLPNPAALTYAHTRTHASKKCRALCHDESEE